MATSANKLIDRLYPKAALLTVLGIHLSASYITVLEALMPLGLLLLIGATLWLKYGLKRAYRFERTGYEPVFLCLLVASVFSALDAFIPSQAWAEVGNWLVSLLAFYLVYTALPTEKAFKTLTLVLLSGLGLFLLAGVLQILNAHFPILYDMGPFNFLSSRPGSERVASLFLRRSGINAYACYLALSAPLYITWLVSCFRQLSVRLKVLHTFFLSALIANILFTYSRALLIAMLVVVLVVVLRSRYRWLISSALSFVLILAILLIMPLQRTIFSLFDPADTSNADHLSSFRMAIQQIVQHPVNGWGGGHVKLKLQKQADRWVNVYNTYKNPLDKKPGATFQAIHEQALKDGVFIIHSPHNMFFSFALNYGFLGLLAFVGIFWVSWLKVKNILEHTAISEYRALALGAGYGLLGMAVYSWFQDSLITSIMGLLFWLFLIFLARLEYFSVPAFALEYKRPLILAYHRVLPEVAAQTLAVSTGDFQRQIQLLKNKKYMFMTLGAYYTKHILGKEPINNKLAILTFDDGYADNYLHALPILQAEQVLATFFVTTNCIEQQRPYYWDLKNKTQFVAADLPMSQEQLKDLQHKGMEIGSHTVNHYELTSLNTEAIHQELTVSKKTLEKMIAAPLLSVCYPRGMADAKVVNIAQAVGYKIGVVTKKPGMPSSLMALPRVGIYGHDTYWTFMLKISPMYLWLRGLR